MLAVLGFNMAMNVKTFFLKTAGLENNLGDNCIQKIHLGRYIVRY